MRISDWSSDVCSSDLNLPEIAASLARRPYPSALRSWELNFISAYLNDLPAEDLRVLEAENLRPGTLRSHPPARPVSRMLNRQGRALRDILDGNQELLPCS